jgi:tetratricopeptide (TPR) repeat protein
MINKDRVCIEKDIPLAKSILWKWQREFFEKQGIAAWVRQVPFYITSNPYIASSYANIIIRFIQDCVSQKNYHPIEPFYIIELGAGHGMFSFYIIRNLLSLQQQLHLKHIHFKYIITDFTHTNINFCKTHPQLQTYIRQGIIDFAVFDAERNTQIKLINSQITLGNTITAASHNPFIVIANYLFDSLVQDVFYLNNEQLQEGQTSITTDKKTARKLQKTSNGLAIDNLDVEFNYADCSTNYYDDNTLNQVLSYYVKNYHDIKFLMPKGSITCVKHLQELSQHQLLLLATDKGFTKQIADYFTDDPHLAYHGSISLPVNFHALDLYTRCKQGESYFSDTDNYVASCAFLFGRKFDELPETQQALHTYFNRFNPENLYNIYQMLTLSYSPISISQLVAYLELSDYDLQLFNQCYDKIIANLKQADKKSINNLCSLLPKLADNFYYLPDYPNSLFNIATLLKELEQYELAIDYYNLALQYISNKDIAYYGLANCYFGLANYPLVLTMLDNCLSICPDNIAAYELMVKAKAALIQSTPRAIVYTK